MTPSAFPLLPLVLLLLPPAEPPVAPPAAPFSPRVTAFVPAGAQRGTEVAVTFRGQRLFEPQGLVLERPGLEVASVAGKDADRCEVTLRVAPDCPLGAHPMRLRTATGLSNLVLFHVGVLPEVREQREGQNAQAIPLGCTVEGELQRDETDRYAVTLDAGAAVTCEVEALRLGLQPVDLALTVVGPVVGSGGAEVASADDSALGRRDPWLSFTAAAAGTYEVRVHGAVGGDEREAVYRLHVGTFARPVGALPCGGRPGEELDVQLLGTGGPARARAVLPDDGSELFAFFPELEGGPPPTPVWLRVGGPRNAPMPDAPDASSPAAALALPAAVHGVLATPGTAAVFRFAGKKDEEVELRAFARQLRSALDPVLTVRDGDGRPQASNDDAATPDSVLRWTPRADGEFEVEVRDLLGSGSPAHFFRLEAVPRARSPQQRVGMVVARDQEAALAVPRGSFAAAVLQLGDPATPALRAVDLPAGVRAELGPRVDGQNLVPLLLAAAADAPLAGGRVGFAVIAGDGAPERELMFAQVITLSTVRNDAPVMQATVRRLPVAVTEPAPFTITVAPPRVPIVRGAPLLLPLAVKRGDGFNGRVRVRAIWTPPGVSAGQAQFNENQDEATLPLEADGGARLGELPCVLVASARVRGGRFEQALPFVPLRVEEPWVVATPGKARTEPGKGTELAVALAGKRPVASPYRALLIGLPRGVTAAEQTVDAAATSVAFPLQVAADAPPGRHRNLQVELRIPGDGGDIVHRFGGGELRIDAPVGQPGR